MWGDDRKGNPKPLHQATNAWVAVVNPDAFNSAFVGTVFPGRIYIPGWKTGGWYIPPLENKVLGATGQDRWTNPFLVRDPLYGRSTWGSVGDFAVDCFNGYVTNRNDSFFAQRDPLWPLSLDQTLKQSKSIVEMLDRAEMTEYTIRDWPVRDRELYGLLVMGPDLHKVVCGFEWDSTLHTMDEWWIDCNREGAATFEKGEFNFNRANFRIEEVPFIP